MEYRKLSAEDQSILLRQNCTAENWNNVEVAVDFSPENIHAVHLSGQCRLGKMGGRIRAGTGIEVDCGIYNASLHNVEVEDQVLIRNVQELSNYHIESDVVIENVSEVSVRGSTCFGNGIEIEVLNEGGGREVPIFDRLSAQLAYLMAIYRHDVQLMKALRSSILGYVDGKRSTSGRICKGSRIRNASILHNVWIGTEVTIEGAQKLEEGTISGEKDTKTFIGSGVIAKSFIVLSGSSVDSGALLDRTFVGQGVKIGKQFSAENCLFFANSEGFHGEAVSVFGGPYTVTHHKSTLLIAGMFSFYNAGSGTNQSNHMYKLGPLHQGIVERGSKTGSFSYLLWPCKVGPFSVVMGKHGANFDTSDLPFSYLTVENEKTVLTPAMNLITVGTRRDSTKWPKRDRRKGAEKLDLIHFELFNPFVIEKILNGIDILNNLYENTPKEQETVNFNGARIKRLMLKSCRKYYEMALYIFIGDQIIQKMNSLTKTLTSDSLRELFVTDPEVGSFTWIDMAGMVVNNIRLDSFSTAAKKDLSSGLNGIEEGLHHLYQSFWDDTWQYTLHILAKRFGVIEENVSAENIGDLILKWKENGIRLNNMILSDAKKEFDAGSRIGFGLDGDGGIRDADFEQVRGTYDGNAFVKELLEENAQIEQQSTRIIELLKDLK